MENKEEEPILIYEAELTEKEEKRLQAAKRKKKFKAMLLTFAIILMGFVGFFYFFSII